MVEFPDIRDSLPCCVRVDGIMLRSREQVFSWRSGLARWPRPVEGLPVLQRHRGSENRSLCPPLEDQVSGLARRARRRSSERPESTNAVIQRISCKGPLLRKAAVSGLSIAFDSSAPMFGRFSSERIFRPSGQSAALGGRRISAPSLRSNITQEKI